MLRKAKTENGWVLGLQGTNARITVYKGVPFAAPPVGENRFRAPQPVKNWEGEKECYRFAPISMQEIPGLADNVYTLDWHVNPDIDMGEDCLYLNIWTPAVKGDEKLPVLVWYFGGGFQVGYPAEMEFDGEAIAKRGVVVVTVNYRVNAFGFIAHPEITKEAPEAPTNFGFLDQQAGLKWVIRNIAAFGGDPKNITIAGQSAGGGSVMSQLTCPKNEGLFQHAIVLSGVFRDPYPAEGFPRKPGSLKDQEQLGIEFFELLGVKTLAEARKLDPVFIRDKNIEFSKMGKMFWPCTDNCFTMGDSITLFGENKRLQVPVLAGNTVDEFGAFIKADSDEDFEKKVREIYKEDADEFLALPEARKNENGLYAHVNRVEPVVKKMFRDSQAAGFDGNLYYYRFNEDIPGFDNPGNFHSSDLWFFFDNLQKCWRPFVGRHYDLARQMCDYWANFIKTGDPNGKGSDENELPKWLPYTKDAQNGMVFDSRGSVPECGDGKFTEFMINHLE